MRALLLLVLLLAAPSAEAAFRAEPVDPVIATDTAHLAVRVLVMVHNDADGPDYFTIPRGELRWADDGQVALGFPSPEFGLALDAHASGPMMARVDIAEPRVGARDVLVPVRSERTGETVTARVRVEVAATSEGSAGFAIRVVDAQGAPVPEARVVVQGLSSPQQKTSPTPGPGGAFTVTVPPGEYALSAHAPGRGAAGIRVTARVAAHEDIELVLRSGDIEATEGRVRAASVGDSAWLLAGSRDLSRLATAPMTHTMPGEGAFVGIDGVDVAWRVPFPAVAPPKDLASQFQALDTAVAVSADGSVAAGIDWNGNVHVVDFEDGATLWTEDLAAERHPLYPEASPYGHGFFTSGAVAFSPDGSRLAAGGSNGLVALFDARDGGVRWTRAFGGEVRALRFSHDGETLFVGAGDWSFRALAVEDGAAKWQAENGFWPFFFIALDEAGERVAAGGKDAALRVWDTNTGELLLLVDTYPAFVTGAGFTPGGAVVLSDWGYGVRAVDPAGELRWFRSFPTANVALTQDGRFAAVAWAQEGGQHSGLELLDASTGATLWTGAPDLGACDSTVSPFPARQLRSVHAVALDASHVRVAAACIGGGVFVADVMLREASPVSPTGPTSPTRETSPTLPTSTGPSPEVGEDLSPTPGFEVGLVALAMLAAAWRRRGPRS